MAFKKRFNDIYNKLILAFNFSHLEFHTPNEPKVFKQIKVVITKSQRKHKSVNFIRQAGTHNFSSVCVK
jgi:hypothetical protein